ncbi:uncharacterized protein LOC108913795 [Anoplophora glabripennis]|uniref:uncharacterized protein LOC108913795 n=1 Tax=Anoplophora glabripennis TaxID=217634 RepID=UPI000874A09F|nr:uncharacterized protein LOC108913795 [Anoplophora glabripennis]
MSTIEFDNILTHLDKYETSIENYLIHQSNCLLQSWEPNQFLAYQEPPVQVKQPSIRIWEFLEEKNLKEFLLLQKKYDIRKYIDSCVGKSRPKGKARKIFVELMYNVTKFCKTSDYNLEKTGALLSQFYLTHLFFTSKLDISAEKVYTYFKDLTMCHSLPFPPNSTKIFSHRETKDVMELFCKLYLRNLPLIRFTSLPNFAFYLNFELEPEPDLSKKPKKAKPEKKEDKIESKKESKKGSKK